MADPAYYDHLATTVTAIERPELLNAQITDGIFELRVRYAFAGEISGPAKMFIDRDKLTWVIHSRWDLKAKTAMVEIIPDHYTDLVVADADMTLAEEGAECEETMMGSLQVKVPLVGAQAEKIIIDGLLAHLAAEAMALGEYAASTR